MSIHPELEDSLAALQSAVPALQTRLAPVLDSPAGLDDVLQATAAPLDRAKLLVTLAFTLHTTLHAYLKVNGADTKAPQIKTQLDRLKTYFEKLKRAEMSKDRARVDAPAAGRFIKAALAGDGAEASASSGASQQPPRAAAEGKGRAPTPQQGGRRTPTQGGSSGNQGNGASKRPFSGGRDNAGPPAKRGRGNVRR
ncbi:DNA-binding protein c1d [Blastocladiella emersonii ATCC 22665]|nr:DNA-binding protein c1d [Blastocladiella emersonii ATCC 22665]